MNSHMVWAARVLRLFALIYERDQRNCAGTSFLAVWFFCLVQTRAGTDARARNQNSHYGWRRGFVRDHFDDAPGAGALPQRLHGFLRFEGDQASHYTYRTARADRRDHWYWR